MSDVTVIGLGAMGSAIANAFLNASYDVTVWNRSPVKMDPFRHSGAECAETVAEAVDVEPVRRARPGRGAAGENPAAIFDRHAEGSARHRNRCEGA
jgi:3-hydroxyacyl-CoA dehydrogenase